MALPPIRPDSALARVVKQSAERPLDHEDVAECIRDLGTPSTFRAGLPTRNEPFFRRQ